MKLLLLLATTLAQAHPTAEEAIHTHDVTVAEMHETFDEKPERCEPSTKEMEGILGRTQQTDAAFFKTQFCAELFATTPPKKYRDLKVVSPEGWWPVCSIYSIHKQRGRMPLATPLEVATEVSKRTRGWDLCAQKPGTMRGEPNSKVHTQRESDLALPDAKTRKRWEENYEKLIYDTKAETTEACCEKNEKDCRDLMGKVTISWCIPQESPDAPDPCIRSGAVHGLSKEGRDRWDEYFTKFKEPPSESEVYKEFHPGHSVVSATKLFRKPETKEDKERGLPLDGIDVISHEFGHACSFVRRQLSTRNGLKSGHTQIDEYRKGECRITPAVKAAYRHLFFMQETDKDAIDCFIDLAEKNAFKRFEEGNCTNGCPRAAIEEIYADFIQFKVLLAKHKKEALEVIRPTCDGFTRDSKHPWAADTFKCILKVEKIRDEYAKVLGCK